LNSYIFVNFKTVLSDYFHIALVSILLLKHIFHHHLMMIILWFCKNKSN